MRSLQVVSKNMGKTSSVAGNVKKRMLNVTISTSDFPAQVVSNLAAQSFLEVNALIIVPRVSSFSVGSCSTVKLRVFNL